MKARRLFKSLDDDETGQISFKEILNHTKDCGFLEFLPVVPALGLCYKTFLLYRTCMRRAPARPVRTCFVLNCCPRTRPARDPGAMQRQAMLCVPKLRLHPSRCRTQRRNRFAPGMNDRSRTRRTHEAHRKTQGFALQLPPQHSPHAKVMQHDVANPHLSTHMATKRDNNLAAITLQSASTDSKTPYNSTTR